MKKLLSIPILAAALLPAAPASAEPVGVYVAPSLSSGTVSFHFKAPAYNNYSYGSQKEWAWGSALAVGYDFHPSLQIPVRLELEYHTLSEVSQSADSLAKSEIERASFTYYGPWPRSKETLLLCIADSLEAASRSLRNPTAQSVEKLVDSIIDGKIKEGQIDECRLTFRDIEKLRKSFYFTLINMLHSRIGYDDIQLDEPS